MSLSHKQPHSSTCPPLDKHNHHPSSGCVDRIRDAWKERIELEDEKRHKNPFSIDFQGCSTIPKQDDPDYGRPVAGSLTDLRGKKAARHISREVCELCQVLAQLGHPCQGDGASFGMEFGPLFEHYSQVSNKVVGILLRARKHGFVDFPGEMLYQRRDEEVFIELKRVPYEDGRMVGVGALLASGGSPESSTQQSKKDSGRTSAWGCVPKRDL